jgi:putative MATE family efflux protein
VLPIIVQSLISALVNSADIVMLGTIGSQSISAVSLAGQVTFFAMLFYFGAATGIGILTAQYWGKGDTRTIEKLLGVGCGLSIIVSLMFFIATFMVPTALMRILTNDEQLIALGSSYLRLLSFTFLFLGISQSYLSAVRSIEQARIAAYISTSGLLCNVVLNALSIYVMFPDDPIKAVHGVALATVAARLLELTLCLVHSARRGKVKMRIGEILRFDRSLLRDFIKYAAPAQGNYLLWGGALTATAAIIGHVSADMVAANSVASVVRNLAMVLCSGVSQGGSILVGKALGDNRLEDAKRDGGRVVRFAVGFGVLACLLILFTKPLTMNMGNLGESGRIIQNGILIISAVYCVGKAANSTVIGGIFTAGGDARFGLICDGIIMWGIVIPLAMLSAFVWKLPPVALFAVISMDEFIKLPFMIIHYRKYGWLKNITR